MGIMRTLTINGVKYDVIPVVPATSVTLLANAWVGDGGAYSQVVAIPGITPNTKVDLQPTSEQLAEFHHKVLAFVAENEGGVVTVFAIGDKPTGDHTIQTTLTEVEASGKIRGNTVGTTMPRPDWDQTDPAKADYIKNKPTVVKTINGNGPDENGNIDMNDGPASEEIEQMKKDIEDIKAEISYEDIAITSFSCPRAGTYEMGQSVAAPTIEWSLNKEPTSQSLNGEVLGVDVRSKEYSGNITSNKTYTLNVTGQKDEKDSERGSFTFYNGVYYGVLAVGAAIDATAISSLSRKELRGDFKKTYPAITAGVGQRHAFAFPTRYGTPAFVDADSKLGADFYKANEQPILFENASRYTEGYDIWLSTEAELGSLKVTITAKEA